MLLSSNHIKIVLALKGLGSRSEQRVIRMDWVQEA